MLEGLKQVEVVRIVQGLTLKWCLKHIVDNLTTRIV